MKLKLLSISLFICCLTFGQSTIRGVVKDTEGNTIAGAKIEIVGATKGYYSDFTGNFVIKAQIPTTIKITCYGYNEQTLQVTDEQKLNIALVEQVTALSTIVVSASRTKEKLIESPVTIQRVSAKDILKTSSSNFYTGLENVKEIHMNSGSFVLKSINTRGFATASNPRFMQLIDGMENTPPGLNVVVGNLLGISQLDVENIEILPGASSALYGANAFNGIMFMNSKSPFTSPGISAYYTQGSTSQKLAGTNSYFDIGVRAAHKFSNKFAIKGNLSYLKGTDWQSNDDRNIALIGQGLNRAQFYDGLSLYGDEIFSPLADQNPATLNPGLVSRTPYTEKELNDGGVKNFKIDGSIHWKPYANDFEIILQHRMGTGSTNYASSDARSYLKNFLVRQSKLEIKGKNFFFRNYLNAEDSGDTYSMTRAAWNINEIGKSNNTWFTDFFLAYNNPANTAIVGSPERYVFARAFADNTRLIPGSVAFNNAFDKVTKDTGFNGAKIDDNSSYFHTEGNYNLRDEIKFAEIQVGGSFRNFNLDSKGTYFSDRNSSISFSEYGIYSQIQKKFLDERLKLTGSIRYDKSQNFNGNVSPRLSLSYAFGKNLQRNFRAAFQTGFRNPTAQDQYYGLNVGPLALVGSAKDNLNRYTETVNLSATGSLIVPGNPTTLNLTGNDAYGLTYSLLSVQNYVASLLAGSPNISLLRLNNTKLVEPERVKSYEIGYRADISNFFVDMNLYYNQYDNFIYTKKVVKPLYGDLNNANVNPILNAVTAIALRDIKNFQVSTNSLTPVKSFGFGLGLDKKFGNYDFSVSYNHAEFSFDATIDPEFQPEFNTPKSRIKLGFGNENLFKNFGFQTNLRWASDYKWQSSFVNGSIPSATVLDAQINYSIQSMKTIIKLGANNLFGKEYIQVLGAGNIGQQYYLSLIFNQ